MYSVLWFTIKKDAMFLNQPAYIFKSIQQMKIQSDDVKAAALENLQHNAIALLPINLFNAMVKSEKLDVREKALKKILSIRRGKGKTPKPINRTILTGSYVGHCVGWDCLK